MVLVDLPGFGDSNTGRTKVTDDYKKNLDYVLIVADINRAVDDKVARELLDRNWKMEQYRAGRYAAKCIAFVVTKTDVVRALLLRKAEQQDLD